MPGRRSAAQYPTRPHVIGPAIGEGFDRMAAFVIRAIDQHTPHAAGAHFAERDFLRVVVCGHSRIIKNPALPREFRRMAKEADRNHRGSPCVWMVAARSPPGLHVARGRPRPAAKLPSGRPYSSVCGARTALNSRAPIDAVRERLRVRELQDHSPPLPEALLALGSHPGQALSRRFVNHAIPVRLINTLHQKLKLL